MTTRRDILAGAGAGAAAISASALFANLKTEPADRVYVFDSRVGASAGFARIAPGGGTVLDISGQDRALWRDIKAIATRNGAVSGLLSWSSWVIVRGFLEEGGKRIVDEQRIETGPGRPTLFYWRMK